MMNSASLMAGMKRRVGWFVMLGVGMLILLLLIVSIRSNIFAEKFYLFISPPSATSFYEGQPVEFQGFTIGRVDAIELQNEGKVLISLRLLERYRHMLHHGSIVQFVKGGVNFLRAQVVELTRGDVKKPMLNDGDVLNYEHEASLDELLAGLEPAVSNANVLLKELAAMSVWINDPDGDVRADVANLRHISRAIDGESIESAVETFTSTLDKFGKLIADLGEQKVVLHLADSLVATADVMKNINPLSKSLAEEAPKGIKEARALLVRLDELSSNMNIIALDLSEATPELPGLAQDLRVTLQEMTGLMKTLQGSWLLGGSSSAKTITKGLSQEILETAPPVLDMQP